MVISVGTNQPGPKKRDSMQTHIKQYRAITHNEILVFSDRNQDALRAAAKTGTSLRSTAKAIIRYHAARHIVVPMQVAMGMADAVCCDIFDGIEATDVELTYALESGS